MNGAQWLVQTLQNRGVDYVFALCGNGLNAFLDACIDSDIKVIDVRNEQAASYMADTWGRMTGRLGVVAVSSGPGHTNALTGLTNSFWDGGPMLLISGCSAQQTRGMDNFQELDQVGMVAPVCKYAMMSRHIETFQHEVNTALSTAVTGRPGPVHLTIPADVLAAQMDESKLSRRDLPSAEVVQRSPGDDELVKDAIAMLASASRPFMVVGSGIFYAHAGEALEEFRGFGLPVEEDEGLALVPGLHHPGVLVPDVVAHKAGAEIEPLPAVLCDEPHTLGGNDAGRRLGRLVRPGLEIVFHFIAVQVLFARGDFSQIDHGLLLESNSLHETEGLSGPVRHEVRTDQTPAGRKALQADYFAFKCAYLSR